MTSVQANGITIEYQIDGDIGSGRPPVLMVMGLGGQLVDWPQGLVDELVGRGFGVIRFDNRDAGLSTEFTGTPPTIGQMVRANLLRRRVTAVYNIDDMAADAAGVLAALGVESAHVVGASMGGMIAQALAIGYPERVESLTSIMSTTGNPKVGRPKLAVMLKTARRGRPARDTAVETAVEQFREVSGPTFDPAEFRVQAEASIQRSWRPAGTGRQLAGIMASPDRTAGLAQVRVPTLVIHGSVDPLVRPSGGLATAAAVPGARLLMFPDMGHDLPRNRWPEIADAIATNAARAAPRAQ